MSTHALMLHREPSVTGRPRRLARRFALLAAAAALAAPARSQAQSCPPSFGAIDPARSNKLYLYFPASDDPLFPSYGTQVSPARTFDVSQLASYTGTASALRNAIHAVVVDDYCELNVQVLQTTTRPPATFARRATVAIGTDSRTATFGQADTVDVGNARNVDFARVWAGWYQATAGAKGGALNGTLSTLDRWATSIGGTAAHEAGHLYGLSHLNGSIVVPGEDALTRHLMPKGSLLTDEHRAGYRRHFNDTEFSILAANVGLSVQTMHNWELLNTNQKNAAGLRIEFLSPRTAVALSGSYAGSRSPWSNPTVSGPLGTRVFNGKLYRRFRITWSKAKAWAGGSAGRVPPGARFVVGATFAGVDFNAPDPIVITDLTLVDALNTPLPLAPRLPGYDAGTIDPADGSFDVSFFDPNGGAGGLVVTDVQVYQLPRVLSIDAMLPDTSMFTWRGEPVLPWPSRDSLRLPGRDTLGEPLSNAHDTVRVPVARLAQGRHIFENVLTPECGTPPGSDTTEVNECVNGIFMDLFPATTVYVVATVVDPRARHWDPGQGRFVVGPVRSRIFYQFAGHHPDLNRNGTDDAIDLFRGTSRDADHNGVPDDAPPVRAGFRWRLRILLRQ
ncbi:MAG: hypothetical protein ACJ8GN_16565 [Longimicrobiaceae bacterium]